MSPLKFLQAVWPDEGYYCIVTSSTPPNADKPRFHHATFETIKEAAAYIEKYKNTRNTFFSVLSLKEQRVWDKKKVNPQTGEIGAWAIRTQSNSFKAKAFFLDLDVGENKPNHPAYGSQEEALKAIRDFCKTVGLPKPMIVSSGGGIHIYWLMLAAIGVDEWRATARLLHALIQYHGLRADPSRTRDSASVLRVAGTFNLKKTGQPRPVRVYSETNPISYEDFNSILKTAAFDADINIAQAQQSPKQSHDEGNLSRPFIGPETSFRALLAACPQMQEVVRLKGDMPEPLWYKTLALVRHVHKGEYFCHKISEKYAGYTPGEVDAKIAQLKAKDIGPSTCESICSASNVPSICDLCKFNGKVTSPIVAARFRDEAPPPLVEMSLGDDIVASIQIPNAPKPFKRLNNAISMVYVNKDGEDCERILCNYDLYPLARVRNHSLELEQQQWVVKHQNEGEQRFEMDADALYDTRKFSTIIANRGIYIAPNDINFLREYMVAYIQELQKQQAADEQNNHLGWTEDCKKFIMPTRVFQRDGSVRPTSLSKGAARASAEIKKKGTLQKQVELLRFYARDEYLPHQFFVGGSLASILYHMTGHHGIVVNATGPSGASKSTALYTAASLWGAPKTYAVNGTNRGATSLALGERITTLSNLPIAVDEITKMPKDTAVDLVMSITQPGHRIRLDQRGIEREHKGGLKSSIMLTTANSSLHIALSTDNATGTAGSMRVFEINMNRTRIHSIAEADDYLSQLCENYGHVGEVFVNYVIKNYDAVAERVKAMTRRVADLVKLQQSERFWCSVIACIVVSLEIAYELGLLCFDAERVLTWATNVQIPFMRGIVREEYTTPIGMLSEYMEKISGDMIVVEKVVTSALGQTPMVIREPRGAMLGHYDVERGQMWLLKKGFKDYCDRIGANYRAVLDELSLPMPLPNGEITKVILDKNARKVLGSGTSYAKAQSTCIVVNMRHPEVSGVAITVAASNADAVAKPSTAKLSVVK